MIRLKYTMNTGKFNLLDKFIARYRLMFAAKYIERNDVILDFGCGVQHYLLSSAKNKFKIGYGLDYDVDDYQKENIILIKHRYQGALPFNENFFDKIFMLAVLEHVEKTQVQALFFEFYRVLKPCGHVIMTSPTPQARIVLEFLAFKLKIISIGEIADHKHYYSTNEICDLAAVSNLKVIEAKLFQFGLNSLYIMKRR